MPRLNLGQKAHRVLRLLLALRNPRITAQLLPYGLTQAEIDEGWRHLQDVSSPRLDVAYLPPDPDTIDALDAWENKWFPIVQASLGRHYPKLAERIFRNLNQTEGPDVVVSVSTFIQRLDAIATDPEGPAARQLLTSRGLTSEVVEAARAHVRSLGQLAPVTVLDTTELQERWRAAEERLWAWYLEWSQIIRTAIKDRRLLAQLGFLSRRGNRLVEVTDDDDVTDEAINDDGISRDGASVAASPAAPAPGDASPSSSTAPAVPSRAAGGTR